MKEDEFIIELLKTLKEKLEEEGIYSGKSIRTLIDGIIERMR